MLSRNATESASNCPVLFLQFSRRRSLSFVAGKPRDYAWLASVRRPVVEEEDRRH